MQLSEKVKIVVTVPDAKAHGVRVAVAEAGAGRIGSYVACSFSVQGVGRFMPVEGASPAIGEVGTLEEVIEQRIEWICDRAIVANVVSAIRMAHPYEVAAIDVYALEVV